MENETKLKTANGTYTIIDDVIRFSDDSSINYLMEGDTKRLVELRTINTDGFGEMKVGKFTLFLKANQIESISTDTTFAPYLNVAKINTKSGNTHYVIWD
jgi:hypothetical protein